MIVREIAVNNLIRSGALLLVCIYMGVLAAMAPVADKTEHRVPETVTSRGE